MIPCNRDPDLRRDLRAAILEEVTSTELRLRSLYTQLNALAPVSLLPTELLARIFHLYRDDENNYTNARLLLSVAVSHVCRRWREVAFGDPSLWGEIRNTVPRCNQRWLTEMLTHPTNVPLDIRLHGPHTDRLLHSLTRHSSRISRLSLLGLKDGDAVQALLEMEAPVLEDLHMEISTTARWPTVVSHDPAFPTGGFRLFHRQSSELRKIYLYNIHVPWAYFPTCTLTHLEIMFEPPDTAELPQLENLDDLVDVIASSPCLERLTLDHCIAPVFSQSSLLAETVIELHDFVS
ncbi:hypothetical protein BC834DRAFT_670952 [Gloeopeniophorella convolvens]|nr:hypothetical protein BC834DRAFT_670952 [Gloeopeniophorella convolvens]